MVAEIWGTRRFRRALREAIRPSDLLFDSESSLWRIRRAAWTAACAIFWEFQMSVDVYEVPDHAGPQLEPRAVLRAATTHGQRLDALSDQGLGAPAGDAEDQTRSG